jgi:RsiG-like
VPASLDDILAPGLLDDLEARPLDEVRTLRDDCQQIEGGLSYTRRMVHGHLDIVRAELIRRSEGGDPNDLSGLIARLPELLSDHEPASADARSPRLLEVAEVPDELQAQLDDIVETDELADLRTVAAADLGTLTDRLVEFEDWVSERRRAVQERLDRLQAEIARRYRDGEASVDSILA